MTLLTRVRQVILQPTSQCNLNCTYCYVSHRRESSKMAQHVLEAAISKILSSHLVRHDVEFLWHAGEPLLAGLEHYRLAMRLIDDGNARGIVVRKNIQTNATLVSKTWADFLFDNTFTVGVSVDGPAWLHDTSRKNWGGLGSHEKVMAGYRRLVDRGLRPGAICVLTRKSLDHPDELFDFFREAGFCSVAFNVEEVEGANLNSSLEAFEGDERSMLRERYRRFMSRFYDRWLGNGCRPRVREFSNMLSLVTHKLREPNLIRRPWETLPMAILTIQKNGDISTYSPEFAGASSARHHDFVLGNITEIDSLEDLVESPALMAISSDVLTGESMCAQSCLYYDLCGSGYTSNKFYENGTICSTETTACRLHRQELASVVIEKLS